MHVFQASPKTLTPAVDAPLKMKSGGTLSLRSYRFFNFKQLGSKISKGKGHSYLSRRVALRVKYESWVSMN